MTLVLPSFRLPQRQQQSTINNDINKKKKRSSGQQDIAHFSTFWIPQDSVQLAWDPFAVTAATGANATTSNSTTRTSNSRQNQNSTTTTHTLAMELLLLRHTPLSMTTSRRHRHHTQEWQQLLHYQVQQSHLAIRNWFWERYGGEYGRSLLTHSIRLIHQCHPQQHAQQQPQQQQTKQQPTTSKGFHNSLDSLVHALRRQLMVATIPYQDKNNNNQKKNDQKPSTTWHVVVLGNGAAAGYGNYRYQAYSQQLQRVLNQILNKAVLQLLLHVSSSSSSSSSFSQLKQPQHPTIQVTNLALDQSTEFPTTWCLSSSLWLAIQQQQKDNNHNRNPTRTSNNSPYSPSSQPPMPFMVIWDFTGSTPRRLEAVLRYLVTLRVSIFVARPPAPMDTEYSFHDNHHNNSHNNNAFWQVLSRYCPSLLQDDHDDKSQYSQSSSSSSSSSYRTFDACLWLEPFEQAMDPFLESVLSSSSSSSSQSSSQSLVLPTGWQGWTTRFGTGRQPLMYHALDHLPHQRPHYLTVPQHEWIAWTIAMPFLSAIQVLVQEQQQLLTMAHADDDSKKNDKNHNDVGTNPSPQQQQQSSSQVHDKWMDKRKSLLPPPLLLETTLDPLILRSGGSGHTDGAPPLSSMSPLHCFTSFEYMVRQSNMSVATRTTTMVHDGDGNRPINPDNDDNDLLFLSIPGTLSQLLENRRNVLGDSLHLLKPKLAIVQQDAWLYDLDVETKRDKRQMQHYDNPIIKSHHQAFPTTTTTTATRPVGGVVSSNATTRTTTTTGESLSPPTSHRRHGPGSRIDPATAAASFYGMPDWKIAYYGTYQSGILKLNVPIAVESSLMLRDDDDDRNNKKKDSMHGFGGWLSRHGRSTLLSNNKVDENNKENKKDIKDNDDYDDTTTTTTTPSYYNASHYIQSLIVCQADTPMETQIVGCSWARDVQIRLGGRSSNNNQAGSTSSSTNSKSNHNKKQHPTTVVVAKTQPLDTSFDIVVSTCGGTRPEHTQSLCRRVMIPPNAQLLHQPVSSQEKNNKDNHAYVSYSTNDLYLYMEIEVTNRRVIWHPKHSIPCSLSHILVEPVTPFHQEQ